MPRRSTPPRVLVVEDDADVRSMLTAVLEDDGWRVLATGRAPDPADVAQLRPDVVLLDLHLPGATDGWGLLEELRATPAACRLPVVVCTADHRDAGAQQHRLRALGADLLLKPFDLQALLDAVAARPAGAETPA